MRATKTFLFERAYFIMKFVDEMVQVTLAKKYQDTMKRGKDGTNIDNGLVLEGDNKFDSCVSLVTSIVLLNSNKILHPTEKLSDECDTFPSQTLVYSATGDAEKKIRF